MDEEGNIQSREFLSEELVDDEVEDLGFHIKENLASRKKC
jgi:hypothetical protein